MATKQYSKYPDIQIDAQKKYKATIKTSKGDIKLELYPDDAPLAVNNFVALARDGYYNKVTFHRVVPGFVIQGGDPTGTGRGGPGYNFKDEPINREYLEGTLAMANAGRNTNGSQFFICLEDLRRQLDKNYTIFGQTIEGLDVVKNIRQGDVMETVEIEEE